MTLSDRSQIVKSDNVLLQELENEAVLLNLANNQYYRLDADSLRMFTVMTSAPSLGAALTLLTGEYEVTPADLRGDLEAFIESLVEAGIVWVMDEPLE